MHVTVNCYGRRDGGYFAENRREGNTYLTVKNVTLLETTGNYETYKLRMKVVQCLLFGAELSEDREWTF